MLKPSAIHDALLAVSQHSGLAAARRYGSSIGEMEVIVKIQPTTIFLKI